MQNFMSVLKKIAICAAAVVAVFLQTSQQPVLAKGQTEENTGWLRAKLSYEFDSGVTGLSDDIIIFGSDKWKKTGDWYYYSDPVESGQKIRFIDGVKIPSSWTNNLIDKGFRIIVTVEAAEVAPGESGWNRYSETVFAQSFELWNNRYTHDEDIYVKQGKLTVSINEYQMDKNGKLVKYVNNKVVTPGQTVSKIVEFELNGEKGGLVKLKPEKPVKTVYASNINVDGKTVDAGTVLTYGITIRNPAPDERTITITDEVDSRLTIIDTVGGTLISGSIGGRGGTIEWVADVPGGESVTVHFLAQLPDEIEEGEGMTVPNTAIANIFGRDIASNTVITSIGKVSKLQQLVTRVTARATGDASHLWIYLSVFILTVICLTVVITIKKWKKKKI